MNKGTVFDIKRFAVNDGPGIRTVVFLKGCPLQCRWCHNPEGMSRDIERCTKNVTVEGRSYSMPHTIGYEVSASDLVREVLKDRVFMEDSGGGVTFSGGEPLLQHELLAEVLERLHRQGVHTAVDTSGYASWSIFEKINPYTDLYLFDLKCTSADRHLEMTGVPNAAILENLRRLTAAGKRIHIRIPVIPTFNYDEEELQRMASFLTELGGVSRIDLLPYHKVAQSKYARMGIDNPLFKEPSLTVEELSSFAGLFTPVKATVTIGG